MSGLPAELRPRERLLASGARALSEAELVAVLLGTGRPGQPALRLAEELLARLGGLRGLVEATAQELSAVAGVGPARAARLKAALELARRLAMTGRPPAPVVRTPDDVFHVMLAEERALDREQFWVLLLDVRHRLIAVERVSVGSLDTTPVHPREVFKPAIRNSSAAVVLVHNHPSGDPTPSGVDVELTRRLVEAGRLLGIEVLDHVVLADNRHASLRRLGYL